MVEAAGYLWPQHSIARAELQRLLLAAAEERLGPDRIQSGHHLAAFQARDDGVTAKFVDRASARLVVEVEGDLLVGTDGIHSTVRREGRCWPTGTMTDPNVQFADDLPAPFGPPWKVKQASESYIVLDDLWQKLGDGPSAAARRTGGSKWRSLKK